MNGSADRWLAGLLALSAAGAASAQDASASRTAAEHASPASAAARAAEVEKLEPAVDVGGRKAAAAGEGRGTALAASAPKTGRAAAGGTASRGAPGARPSPSTGAAVGTGRSGALDRVDLGTTSITGNQELPKVLYIVPWKKSDLGDVVGRPVNTLIDEVLSPVDPDVFKRKLEYYDELFEAGGRGGAPNADRSNGDH